MEASTFITSIRQQGYSISAVNGNLGVRPASRLNETQREWIKANKPAILAALRSVDTGLEAGQDGNDLEPANNRVLIHVPELTLSSGQRIACDMTVPRSQLEPLHAVIRFMLKDDGGGGSLLGSTGSTESELRGVLDKTYGERLESMNGILTSPGTASASLSEI